MKLEIKKDIYEEIHELLSKARQNIISNYDKNLFFNWKKNSRRRTKWK